MSCPFPLQGTRNLKDVFHFGLFSDFFIFHPFSSGDSKHPSFHGSLANLKPRLVLLSERPSLSSISHDREDAHVEEFGFEVLRECF